MNDFDKEKFEELKSKVEKEYKEIGSFYSPALKEKIVFNANGWHHLRCDK